MSQISIIGTRTCGKTTYLAALARFPHQDEYPGLQVTPIGDDAKELVGMANTIIATGLPMPGNRKQETRREYELDIKIPKLTESVRLLVKDSAGELFDELVKDRRYWPPEIAGTKEKEGEQAKPGLVDELCQATGWIVMTDWIKEADTKIYQPALQNLLHELNLLETKNKDMPKKRIAVVMSKCERGEAWTGRLDPGEDLFRLRLPETYKELQKSIHLPKRICFFACSSFGVLGDKDPRPNRLIQPDNDRREYAYLMDSNRWRPYGLFSPIYWLIKGRRYKDESL
jgi:hypothetical protein